MTYHNASDTDIPAFNVVGTLLFPHAAMYYYTFEGALCLVVTSAVMHATLTKAPPPFPQQTVFIRQYCL